MPSFATMELAYRVLFATGHLAKSRGGNEAMSNHQTLDVDDLPMTRPPDRRDPMTRPRDC
jgi:hypothetical protein